MTFSCSWNPCELPHRTLSIQSKPYGSVQNNMDTWLSENNKFKPRNVQQCKLKLDTIPNNTRHVNNLIFKPLEGAKKPICFQRHILSNSLQPVDLNLFSCGDRNQIYKIMDLLLIMDGSCFCDAACRVTWSVLTCFHSLHCESHSVFPGELNYLNCLKVFSNQINLNDTNLNN